jgi:hypothetical protein
MNEREFFALLDEVPRTPNSVLVRTRQGETRTLPISALRGRIETRSACRHPRVEARARWLELMGYLLEKEDIN